MNKFEELKDNSQIEKLNKVLNEQNIEQYKEQQVISEIKSIEQELNSIMALMLNTENNKS